MMEVEMAAEISQHLFYLMDFILTHWRRDKNRHFPDDIFQYIVLNENDFPEVCP